MKQLRDPVVCRQIADKYPRYFTFDVEDWFSKAENFALIEGENIGFAEYKSPGVYWVHFCFHTARGRQAINLTKEMLSVLFRERDVASVLGLIEAENKKARWLVKQAGLTSLGLVQTKLGLCEMFYLTRSVQHGFI
jgi:hypothetical protein